MQLGKVQANQVLRAIIDGGISPYECTLEESPEDIVISHPPSGSYCIFMPQFLYSHESENAGDAYYYDFRYKVWNDPARVGIWSAWEVLLRQIQNWANEVITWPDIPDYWELLRNSWQNLASSERNWANTPFLPEEQAAISAQLTVIKESVRKTRSLRKDQMSLLEEKLDKLERASHREGRIDWRNLFVNTIVALIITDTITPEVFHHILMMIAHGIGHLLGGQGLGLPPIPPRR